ncbi:MAG: hypothetical protein ABFC96_17930 [Thermoguttaceae bacterium]
MSSLSQRAALWVPLVSVVLLALGSARAAEGTAPDVQGPAATSASANAVNHQPTAASDASLARSDRSTSGSKKKPVVATAAKKAEAKKTGDKAKETTETVGEPLAPGMMKLLRDEIVTGIRNRGITDHFVRFQNYAIGKVNSSAGRYTGSELAGNCRLRWYDHMMRDFLGSPAEAERFTRELHLAAINDRDGLARALAIAAVKMDAGQRKARKPANITSPEQALEIIKQAATGAQVSYCAALAPLSKQEIRILQEHLVPVLCTQNQVGHTLNDRGTGRQLCDLMEKMDREALHEAAEALAPIADIKLLEQLKSLPAKGNVQVAGVTGQVVDRIDTPAGAIIIGGRGPNIYQLDQMRDVAVVIDLGGGNAYFEGTVGLDRPVLVVINLDGKNVFRGSQAGIQGGAVLGVSMVANLGGDNVYEAKDVAQGSAVAGVGLRVDYGPNNRYRGVRRVQGQAIGGVGILISHGGHNDYHAAMWAQGFGNPLGFGLLENVAGNNHYYCGGMWRNSYYPETPGYEGWGQGVGAGIRQVADGGVGVILDGGGENTYEFDYLSHGGGYWCGLGFARDFGGNTKRLICKMAYDGSPRTQTSFQRFGCGWGCHYAQGFMFDDSGDDQYDGTIMGTGMAWDCSLGVLCDFAGNDHYTATGGLTQGTAHQMGMGILFDYRGDDVYEGYGQGYAATGISYHDMPSCGGNFAFLIDYGGKDTYGCEAENNSYIQRGDVGGFLIDRPRQDEIQPAATAQAKTAAR